MKLSLLKNNIKAYITFLDRNKLYTAINVFGLSISLMFVILISNYIIIEAFKDINVKKADRIYSLGTVETGIVTGIYVGEHLKCQFPQIEESCWVSGNIESLARLDSVNGDFPCILTLADSSFFNMFSVELLEGKPDDTYTAGDGVFISASFAERLFPNENAIGKNFTLQFSKNNKNNTKQYIVSGIFKDLENSIFVYNNTSLDIIATTQEGKHINEELVSPSMSFWGYGSAFLLANEGEDLRDYKKEITKYCVDNYWAYQHLKDEDDKEIEIVPFREVYFNEMPHYYTMGDKGRIKTMLILGIVILIFAILNYVNLTTSQIAFRAKEMATRRVLGVTQLSIFWKSILESTIITTIAFILGFMFAIAAQDTFNELLYANISVFNHVSPPVIIGYVTLIFITSFISGVIPGFLISKSQPLDVIKGKFTLNSKKIYGGVILVVQNCITVVFLCMGVAIYMQINHMITAPLNYNSENIISIPFPYSKESIITESHMLQLKDEFDKLPYVEDISFCYGSPLDNGGHQFYNLKQNSDRLYIRRLIGDEAYFRILGFKVKQENNLAEKGWYFSESFFSTLGISEDTKVVKLDTKDRGTIEFNVSGVIENIVLLSVMHQQTPVQIYKFQSFFPMSEADKAFWGEKILPTSMLVKINEKSKNPVEAHKEIRKKYEDITNLKISYVYYLTETHVGRFYSEKQTQTIVSIFVVITIIISSLGLLAMSTYYTQQQKKSIAIKKIFGATAGSVLKQTILHFMLLVGISFVIATPIAYYVIERWLQNYSYRIEMSPMIFILSGVFTTIIAFAAGYWQSRRAACANPADTVRN